MFVLPDKNTYNYSARCVDTQMYGVLSQNKNPERLMHEHLFITIAICWFILVTNSFIKCKIEYTKPSQQFYTLLSWCLTFDYLYIK
jgi:membrane-associated HD superfamily phosphohydrolase